MTASDSAERPHQNSEKVSESLPEQALLDTLFGAVNPDDSSTSNYLNIPGDPFYANTGFMTQEAGPNRGLGSCYKPGCTQDTGEDPNARQTCTGP